MIISNIIKYFQLEKRIVKLEKRKFNAERMIDKIKNPNNFVEWQKKCVCDFIESRNNNSHSFSCMERYNVILEKLESEGYRN